MQPEAPATEAIPAITLDETVSTLQTQLVCSDVRQVPYMIGLSNKTAVTLPETEASLSIIERKPTDMSSDA